MHLTGDGPFGREAFRIPRPSGVLVVRSGWWTLRSLTRATTLPILTRREGRRLWLWCTRRCRIRPTTGARLLACRAAPVPLTTRP